MVDDLKELARGIERLWADGEISYGLKVILLEMMARIEARAALNPNNGGDE